MKHGYPYTKTIAHRGAGNIAPENTMAALRMAHTHGLGAVEFDVMLSQDKIPMLNHDNELGRNLHGQGAFIDYTSEHLQNTDAGSYHSPEFSNATVPTFHEALQFCIQHDLWMNIEIKPYPEQDKITAEAIAHTLQNALTQRIQTKPLQCLISSFSIPALEAFHQQLPDLPIGILWDTLPNNWYETAQALNCESVHLNYLHTSQHDINAIKCKELSVLCYTVNDQKTAETLINWGIDGFFSDHLNLLLTY